MFQTPEILGMAASMAGNAATRMSAIAQNVANADTPGYRAKDVQSFAESYRAESGLHHLWLTAGPWALPGRAGVDHEPSRVSGDRRINRSAVRRARHLT